jgi:hypothetical protein
MGHFEIISGRELASSFEIPIEQEREPYACRQNLTLDYVERLASAFDVSEVG